MESCKPRELECCISATSASGRQILAALFAQRVLRTTEVCGSTPVEEEPLYGLTYLPRKYKVAVAVPPSNDVDLFSNCVGFIAIVENDQLLGPYQPWHQHTEAICIDADSVSMSVLAVALASPTTTRRLTPGSLTSSASDAKWVCEAILTVQRDFGDRTNRSMAVIALQCYACKESNKHHCVPVSVPGSMRA
eukprot:6462481-Amphidinium_carterae.3